MTVWIQNSLSGSVRQWILWRAWHDIYLDHFPSSDSLLFRFPDHDWCLCVFSPKLILCYTLGKHLSGPD